MLPTPVVRPYIERLWRDVAPSTLSRGREGLGILAERTGVDPRVIKRILEGTSRSVSLETAEKLALGADFTVQQLQREATLWAMSTKSRWPEGYAPKGAARRAKT